MLKILITGATGLVGLRLLRKLVEKGYEDINILTRDKQKTEKSISYPCNIFEWKNPSKEIPPIDSLKGVVTVIHLAGESVAGGRWSKSRKEAIYSSRIDSTKNLWKAINSLENKTIKNFISSSAIGYYGDRSTEALDEKSAVGNGFLADVCKDWEQESLIYKNNTRVVLMRTGVVLAESGGALEKMLPPFKMGVGGILGDGKHYMSWIHLDDLVEAFIFCIENDKISGAVNCVAPGFETNAGFTKKLAKSLNRPAIFPVPAFMLKLIFGEMSSILLESQKVIPQVLLDNGFRFKYPKLDEALENLVFKFVHNIEILEVDQWVNDSVQKTFSFFSDAKNLEKITPSFLNFNITYQSTDLIQEGTEFEYKLKIHGLPMKWRSKITNWKKDQQFKDIQLKGPYNKWDHTHSFIAYKGGTIVRDRVEYRVPGGAMGRIFAGCLVKRDVQSIFTYRQNKIKNYLGS